MTRRSWLSLDLAVVLLGTLAVTGAPAQAPKRGGILNAMLIENPPGFSIHEAATIAGVWPVAPCYSNLVIFDPLKPLESVDTIIPELAEKWSWQDNYRNLVFFLRRNVKWHDGQPFTAKDVKYTFDVVREAPDAAGQAAAEPAQGLVRERRGHRGARAAHRRVPPQAAAALAPADARLRLLAGLSGPRAARTTCASAAWAPGRSSSRSTRRGQMVEMERNPDYFVAGPAVPRRHPLPDHHRARHAAGRAAGRAASTSRCRSR